MKHISLCLCMCVGLIFLGQAQFRKIPLEVTDAFEKKYPRAEEVAWSSRTEYFQAAFSLYGIAFTADFTRWGAWQQSAQEILPDKLPQAVARGWQKSKFTDWKIVKAAFIVSRNETTSYRLYVSKSGIQFRYLFFTPEGQLEKETLTL
ncbi:hypothetical protein [Filimonas effusa]|uniref:Uncharacterized protein n=1 Tax=Filimonas effusa TaxID=2508721 RepID=A0A4Q1DEL2_9BACT|nr:hypothetical protein [Filimonas effusa]RXK87365.1 hypothetical protein ESB13_11470 [Filimonas effusa]